MASFSERLRQLRAEKNSGQKEAGAVLGVSDSSIRKYDSGERTPDPTTIVKRADYFDVTTNHLLRRTTSPHRRGNPRPAMR
jgi:transcriptional regulator with XRE-family HTH domain